ncbi:MAG: SRPBCC domain-containing protein [Chloroflexota bacterium]|nr:SRPBCC domain-containing protein [Chloroflexota bacterium]
MPITSVDKDPRRLTLTVIGDYPVTQQRLWNAYAEPRQLERFWGPVEWPATFTRHDMQVGGRSEYYMTGPNGEKSAGYWTFLAVDPIDSFEVKDGFATEEGKENTGMPSMTMKFSFQTTKSGARVQCVTTFPSLEAMEQLTQMGMEEGMRSAMGQLDAVLA